MSKKSNSRKKTIKQVKFKEEETLASPSFENKKLSQQSRPNKRSKKPSALTELKLAATPTFLSFFEMYSRQAKNISGIGIWDGAPYVLDGKDLDSRKPLDVFISWFHFNKIFTQRSQITKYFYQITTHLKVGGCIVGAVLDGQEMLKHKDIECKELDNHELMVGKNETWIINYDIAFSLQGESSLLVEWNQIEKTADSYHYRLVQNVLEGYVRIFVFQLVEPLFKDVYNSWNFMSLQE
jgi:hypothetical protein